MNISHVNEEQQLDVSCTIVMCSCSDGTWRFLNMALPQGELSFYQSWTKGIQHGVDTKGVHDRTSSWIHFFHLCLLESHCHEQEGGCIRLILGWFVYADCPVAQSNGMKWQSNELDMFVSRKSGVVESLRFSDSGVETRRLQNPSQYGLLRFPVLEQPSGKMWQLQYNLWR